MFIIIIETIVNIEHEDKTCFKGHRFFFSNNVFMSIRDITKKYKVPITSPLH